MRSSAPAALLALALLGIPAAGAAAPSVDPSCGTPLGLEAANGSNSPLERAGDPEYDAVDALRLPGAQRSPGAVVSAWGRLVLIAEAKVDQGTNFTWGIFARIHSNVTGWNTPAVWLSSPNTTQAYPAGVHVRPSAALFGERVWVAWDAQGSGLGSPGDRMILLRAIDSAGAASPAVRASETSASATTQHAVLHASSDGLVLAYSTSEGDGAVGDTHIVVRTFDGSTFGPTVAISNVSDGLSDALPALADDGAGGLVAAWTATDASGSSTRLMFARYSGGSWAAPRAVAELGSSPSSAPALGHVGGHLFLAYSTTHAPDLNGTDSDVMVTAYDLGSGGFVPAVRVNPEPSNGDDTAPTLSRVGDLLYVGWSTDEDFYYAAGSDTDAVYRTLDGNAFGPVVSLSDPALNNSDASPRFVGVGSHVYAHWMVTPPPVAGAPRGDSREAVRLVTRPAQWYDNLTLGYRFPAVSDNGSALLQVTLPSDPGVAGHEILARLPDGTLVALSPGTSGASAWVPLDPAAANFELLACGKPVGAVRLGEPLALAPPGPLLWILAVLALVGLSGALWWWRARS